MKLYRFLYKLYIFLIPFGTLFNIRGEGIGFWYYFSASNLVMMVGVMLLLLNNSLSLFDKTISKWVRMVIFMIFYTTLCAVIVDFVWGDLNGESSYSVIPHSVFFLGIFLLTILYNYTSFKRYIKFKELFPIFKVQSAILLFVGLVQYFTLQGFGPAAVLNEALSMVLCVRDSEYLFRVGHGITLFGTEPSSVASICLWLLPFIFLYAYYSKKKLYFFEVLIWSFLLCNSGSTSNLISYVTMMGCLFFVIKGKTIPRFVYALAFLLGFCIALTYAHADLGRLNANRLGEHDLKYILYGKVFDVSGNGSTVVRASSVANGIKVFEEFPLTGIGDGLQGYRFNQNAPDWVKYSVFTEDLLSGEYGIIEGGGGFFCSYLSGFGVIGLFVLLGFLAAYKKDMHRMKNDYLINNMFGIAVVIFLYSAWYTMGLNGIVAFVLCLPYAARQKSSENFIAYYFKKDN